MQRVLISITMLSVCFTSGVALGEQRPATKVRRPAAMDRDYFASLNSRPKHGVRSRMSATRRSVVRSQDPRIITIPTFDGSFSFGGNDFPYTMMGGQPSEGRTTIIPTTYIPISLIFDEFIDENGDNIVLDAEVITDEIKHSPLFEDSPFPSGHTQFVDGMMRTQFFPLLNNDRRNGQTEHNRNGKDREHNASDHDRSGGDGFHLMFTTPKTLLPVTIEVPVGSSIMFDLEDGSHMALIDINFLSSQLHTLFQTEPLTVDSIPIFLTRNAVFGDFFFQEPIDCCVGGFHDAFESRRVGNKVFVQTYVFATSLDANVAEAVFRDPTVFADISALSHELAEAANDPFDNNITPAFQLPGLPSGTCMNLLEVGDIIESLPDSSSPITLHGFVYHPQTEALLQWFAGIVPSDALNGAYSFPDAARLTSPFSSCPPTP